MRESSARHVVQHLLGPASLCLCKLSLLATPSLALAQAPAPGDVSTAMNLSVLSQFDTDMEQSGRFSWTGTDLAGSVTRQVSADLSLGVNGRYAYEKWSFDTPTAFGPVAPWTDVRRASLGINLGYGLQEGLSLFAAPQVEWTYETGASTSDAYNYGATFGITKVVSPTLVLGLGVGAFRQVDGNQYFPFVIVNWQITDLLRLSNPFEAGPAGGAGLELTYAWSDAWEISAGAVYREYGFRLRSNGPTPNGIGQNSGAPVFARLTRKFGNLGRLDLFAGTVVRGRLKVMDSTGDTLQVSDYGAAPLIALSGTITF